MISGYTECQAPGCTNQPSERYTDSNGNGLRLCEKHYYKSVTGRISSMPNNVARKNIGTLF